MIVVDTNVLVYRSFWGPKNEDALRLAELDYEWAMPVLWRSEFRNILAGEMRRGVIGKDDANRMMAHASSLLRGGEHQVSDASVFDLIEESRCTAYDCEFVALARSLDTMLVTEDKALLAAFPKHCFSLGAAIKRKR